MLEIILGIGACVVMAKVASADDQSGVLWFFVTFALCIGALFIPLPFIRMLIAGIVAFVAMVGYKVMTNR
ncbi:MAG: hypothetical protein GC164_05875 [Phycisphaera sp.]|nr:hypothetical protein [Phycisphaera sp.]